MNDFNYVMMTSPVPSGINDHDINIIASTGKPQKLSQLSSGIFRTIVAPSKTLPRGYAIPNDDSGWNL